MGIALVWFDKCIGLGAVAYMIIKLKAKYYNHHSSKWHLFQVRLNCFIQLELFILLLFYVFLCFLECLRSKITSIRAIHLESASNLYPEIRDGAVH